LESKSSDLSKNTGVCDPDAERCFSTAISLRLNYIPRIAPRRKSPWGAACGLHPGLYIAPAPLANSGRGCRGGGTIRAICRICGQTAVDLSPLRLPERRLGMQRANVIFEESIRRPIDHKRTPKQAPPRLDHSSPLTVLRGVPP
jgi:hypothetical protein